MWNQSDMILEVAEIESGSVAAAKEVWESGGVRCSKFTVLPGAMSQNCNRAPGEYYAFEGQERRMAQAISRVLSQMLLHRKTILAVGLGNPTFIADRLGTQTLDKITLKQGMHKLYPLSDKLTNISSYRLLQSAIAFIKPDIVIAIDTLSSNSLGRLGQVYQMTTAGVAPGSGVNNNQPTINSESLGVEVLAIGIPLVTSQSYTENGKGKKAYLTLAEIDTVVDMASKIIADSINHATD